MQTFNSSKHLIGLDISEYQGTVDFNRIKANGASWVICRAYGTNHRGDGDRKFEQYVRNARATGLKVGTYYFATPKVPLDLQDARSQAQQFIDKIVSGTGNANDFLDLIPMLDIEDDTKSVPEGQSILLLTVDQLVQWISEFKRYFEDATQTRLGLYCSSWFWKEQMRGGLPANSPLKDVPLWLAEYTKFWPEGKKSPNDFGGWTSWHIWQHSEDGDGRYWGCESEKVDLNYSLPLEVICEKKLTTIVV
ncbi:hypothetical protein AMS62_27775 [Bacillus sp. FJAT-18019]|nr:hypothetical protein AMS62_27775 [Bacillus sp. FJAT-18019]